MLQRQQEDGSKCLLLHIIPAYKIGGVELAAEHAARGAAGRIRVHILASIPGLPRPRPNKWITQGRSRTPLGIAAVAGALRQVRRSKPEVVLFSLWRSVAAFAAIRLLFPRKKLVLFLHSSNSVHLADSCARRLMLMLADEVWADSEPTLRARGSGGRPTRIVSMLLHRPSLHRPEDHAAGEPTFVSWSRLSNEKRIDRALEFIVRLKELRPDVRYTIIGPDEGGRLVHLQALAQRLGLGDHVRFVGAQDRAFIEETAAKSTFYLQLSDFEGHAMAVVEAMQLGLIPVVTPVGAIPDYCQDGVNAIFVNDVATAASRTNAILQEPARLSKIAAAAQRQFSDAPSYVEDLIRAAAKPRA